MVAVIIDGIVLYVGFFIILALIGELDAYLAIDGWSTYDTVNLLGVILYDTILVGAFGATVGKAVVGIKIVQQDGQRVGYGRALGRYLATYISMLVLFIGFLMVAFSQDKRGLHDLIAGTVVVRRN